ncbi:MAG: PQQ-binding-like beta-propeller repeat protein [Phycisphaerae bacterium]|jgi:outer membrane protein assembly factor BamB
MTKRSLLSALATLSFAAIAFGQPPASQPTSQPAGGSWPMWGGSPDRNAVSPAKGIPHDWDLKSGRNIRWQAKLGTYAYAGPVIADGRVYVGTNNAGDWRPEIKGDKGCILCFDARDGQFLWQATHDKLASGSVNDWPEQGIASTPYIVGDRVYYVSNRGELVCADVEGFHDNENDGPITDEAHHDALDADFVWVLDMIGTLGVFPRNLAACSPVGSDDLIFVCTSNGVDDEDELPAPQVPSFLAVNRHTGKVAWQRNDPGKNILRGQWSSPAYGVIAGRPQVVFGGGDGWCYAFDPATGEPLWKFNLNPPDSVWKPDGTGTKTSIVATPVIDGNRVYLAVGDDPEQADGPGHLYAIDATKTGDVTTTGRIWHFGDDDFHRTLSSVVIADGLLYAADLNGFLNCLDAATGQRLWQYDMEAGVWASPAIIDGKVFLGNTDGEMIIVRHGRELEELARQDLRRAIYTPAVAVDDTLYIVTQRTLYAISAAGADPSRWPMFRGDTQLTGVAVSELPDELAVRWRQDLGEAISATAAIGDDRVYIGTQDDTFVALDLTDGHVLWRYKADGAIEASPTLIRDLVIFGTDTGTMHACVAATGECRWKFETKGRIVSSVNWQNDRLVFGSYDGHLYCLSIDTGKPLWEYETGDRLHATPAISGSNVFIGGCDAHLHVVNLTDGQLVRKIALDSVTGCSPAIDGPHVYLGTYGEQVLAIDWQAGNVLWRFEDKDNAYPFLSSAALTPKAVLIGGRDKCVRALDRETGKQLWMFETRGDIDASPVVVGQRVFIGSEDSILYALNLADGSKAWQFETGSPITASAAVAAGTLVIGTDDGIVYCFGAPAKP